MEKTTEKSERTGRTREAVLVAACAVFARHPYNAASIRMIAREGDFGHAVIGYYYPSKALLFTAVAERLSDMLTESSLDWLAEVRLMEPDSEACYQWVNTALVSLFLPMFLRLFGR